MATVQIKIAGTDRASAILFATAYFQSQVNGVAGEARFRIRDPDRTLTILPGALVELIIDGDPVWTGFVSAPKRVYVFPAINIDDFGETRFLDIACVDLNVLFQRRIAFNQIDPENVLAPLYGPNTADTVAIADLVADWLDLSGDGIDTSTFVTGVGDINEDQYARAWSGSDTWGQAMGTIALLPAAIYYLSPSKDLVYCDTDTPTAPFGLSDRPNGSTYLGYREMEILLDGANLANDVMCWGIGYGSNAPVFVRDEDATSQAAHGLWQLGQVTFGIYKQATINRVADSILNGSPDNRRGAKDDRPAVMVTTYEPGLLPSQKVDFVSNVFGWNDVLPIRKMEVTFEAPDTPKYALTLSHEIDTPWSFYDPWRLSLPRLPSLPPFPPWPPLPGAETPGGCVCGITDDYARTVAIGWGTSTYGPVWVDNYGNDAGSVDGTSGVADLTNVADGVTMDMAVTANAPLTGTIDFKFGTVPSGGDNAQFYVLAGTEASFVAYIDSTSGLLAVAGTGAQTTVAKNDWVAGTWYRMRFLWDMETPLIALKVWPRADAEPGSWDVQTTAIGSSDFIDNLEVAWFNGATIPLGMCYVQNFDVEGLNRCDAFKFDTFEGRTTTADWGAASSGLGTWSEQGPGSATQLVEVDYGPSVQEGFGKINQFDPGTVPNQHGDTYSYTTETTGGWSGDFDMVASFYLETLPDAANTGTLAQWALALAESDPPAGFDQSVFFAKRDASFSDQDSLSLITPSGTTTVAKSWSVGTMYSVRWVKTGTTHQVRVWPVGTTEPTGWDINTTGTAITPLSFFVFQSQPFTRVFVSDPNATLQIWWSEINFDYDGKPCYEECAEGGGPLVDEDTFARTISAGSTDLGTSEFDGNPPWVADGTLRPNLSATGGIVTMTAAASPNNRNIQDVVDIDMRLPIDIVFRGRLTPASASGSIVINMEQPPLDGSNYVTIQMATHPTLAAARLVTVGAGDGVTDYSATSNANVILPNVWYTVRATFRRDSVRAKWWADGDPEPDTWTIQVGITGDIIDALDLNNTLELRMTETSELDGIAFYETGCAPVPPEPASPGGPMYGPRCDLAVRIDSTHYQLAMSVSPGTTNVTVGTPGYLYLPGIARDYTCSDEDGILTFADVIADGTRVYVCYQAAGPI